MAERRILLIGQSGQVGWELARTLSCLGKVVGLDSNGLDLARPDSIRAGIRGIKPNIIVNAAAYTAVDKAESEPDRAMAINGIAPGIMAEEAKKINAAIVHYSTDYVFDGSATTPYDESAIPAPLNVYGKTKLEGERALAAGDTPYLVLRTSWVYGLRGKNFLLTMLRLAKERPQLKIVDDQIGAPTWSRIIAEVTALILAKSLPDISAVSGLYHLSAAGKTSWYGFASAILSGANLLPPATGLQLTPIKTEEYPTPAARPRYSLLNNAKLNRTFGLTSLEWDEALTLCMARL